MELLSEGRAGARWRGLVWGRAVTLPTFLEGIVDAAVQAVRIPILIPILPPTPTFLGFIFS